MSSGIVRYAIIELSVAALCALILLWPLNFTSRSGRPILSLDAVPPENLLGMFLLFVLPGVIWWKLLESPWLRHWMPPWSISRSFGRLLVVALDLAVWIFIIELLQAWIPSRESSALDALAGVAGATAGGLAAWIASPEQSPDQPV